jgi:hypothetical protein
MVPEDWLPGHFNGVCSAGQHGIQFASLFDLFRAGVLGTDVGALPEEDFFQDLSAGWFGRVPAGGAPLPCWQNMG